MRRHAVFHAAALAAITLVAPRTHAAYTNTIMITGYWPPTNEMIRPFSQNLTQNPSGWKGGNWEGRGYNIVSYFPEFPGGTGANPEGEGDFRVDYQHASNDFWRITSEIKPVAIITFSRGSGGRNWEIESRHRKLALDAWAPDYEAPFQPTPDLPIASEPDGTIRTSTLPMQKIKDAVNAAGLGFNSTIDTSSNFGGTFVSEFTGYHSTWYQNLHSSPADPAWTVAAGHIHVGISTPLAGAMTATEITLRELIGYVDSVVPSPGTLPVLCLTAIAALRRHRPREIGLH